MYGEYSAPALMVWRPLVHVRVSLISTFRRTHCPGGELVTEPHPPYPVTPISSSRSASAGSVKRIGPNCECHTVEVRMFVASSIRPDATIVFNSCGRIVYTSCILKFLVVCNWPMRTVSSVSSASHPGSEYCTMKTEPEI